jgi:hypothetical protein
LSKDRLKRLAALEARRRPPAVVVDAAAAAALLKDFLNQAELVKAGKASWIPRPPLTDAERADPHFQAVLRTLDRMHDVLMTAEREAAQAKRAAKIARRAARRAAQAIAPAPANELPEKAAQAPAAAAPVAEEPPPSPVSMVSLRY